MSNFQISACFSWCVFSTWFVRMSNFQISACFSWCILSTFWFGKLFKCPLEVVVSSDHHLLLFICGKISREDSGRLVGTQRIRTFGVTLSHECCQSCSIKTCAFTRGTWRTRQPL